MSGIYRKGQVLGWGGVATVFRGFDELLDRTIAIKELIPPFAISDPFVRAYLAQALRMVDISHRNVAATFSVEANRTPPAITREIADETLGHQLIEGPIAPESILRVLRHVLTGLEVIHGRDLLHRAVRPENILVFGDVYKIGDFGLPPVEGAPPLPLRQLKYFAPEVLRGDEEVGSASDLYSLGMVLHELLLGSVRFERIVEERLFQASPTKEAAKEADEERSSTDGLWPSFHLSPLTLPPIHELEASVPVALSLILQKMVCKQPAERYMSCREVLAAMGSAGLVEALGGTVNLMLPSVSRVESPPRSSWVMGGGVLAALALGGTALFVGLREHEGWWPIWRAFSSSEVGMASPGAESSGPKEELLRLGQIEQGLELALEPPVPGLARLPFGSPLRFRVSSDHTARLALFVLSSNGSLTCLYPGSGGRSLEIEAGRALVLPLAEDWAAGFELYAGTPAGRDAILLLASEQPLPPLPPGQATDWVAEYSAREAREVLEWMVKLTRGSEPEARLAVLEIEVVAN